jgi:hypothetical protein
MVYLTIPPSGRTGVNNSFKGRGRRRSRAAGDTIATFVWRDWGNPQETSVRVTGVLVSIRTWYFPNTQEKNFLLSQFAE